MNKTKKTLLITMIIGLLFIGVIPGVLAGPAEESAQLADQWIKAFIEGNTDVIANLYAKDASYWSFLGPFRVEGREAIRPLFAGFFRAYPTRTLVKKHYYVQVYDSTVVRTYYWTITAIDSKGNAKTWHGRANIVYMMVDGQRQIVTHHTSLLPPSQ
jgi:uncharacterized protein (TIGR02246 family)